MEKKEAMKILRDFYDKSALFSIRTALDTVIPELAESEDERIRKSLLNEFIHLQSKGYKFAGLEAEEIVAWLEKQATHVKFIKNIQVGDKVTRNENGELVNLSQLNRVAKRSEQKPTEHKGIPTDIRSIVDKEANAIWKEINTGHNHSIIDTFNQFYGICMQVAEAVMEYNKPAEWSEEEKKMLGKCIDAASGYYSPEDKQSMKSWLYSLKERYTWKPSDGQMEALSIAMQGVNDPLFSLYQDLKKLREE